MKDYLFLFRGGDAARAQTSPEEMQEHMQKWGAWMQGLSQKEVLVGGLPLDKNDIPDINLGNIFAPGLYHVWGFANIPISLGFGGQLGPELRDLAAGVTSKNAGPNFSIRFFVAVDIPIINFYTKSR